ncbi:MAG TPA: hypothetical protein VKB79_27745 [Bryobacteraceae bacterium]|nr:hypothetical protein [Bryobacteraceae bacterium]
MMEADSPSFFSLTPEQVEEQIKDLERLDGGATLFYAVDPHEIFDFCLPVFGSEAGKKDIKRIADDQIALYYVFFKFQPPPILLREYDPEMDQMLWHVRTSASKGFNRLESVQRMLEHSAEEESLKDYVLKNFNVLLAAVMDVYSTGAERLQRIARRLSEPPPPEAAKVLADSLAGYRISASVETIFDRLLKGVKFRDTFEERKIRDSADLDAKAIHKLVFINESLIRAYREKRIAKPVFCLYLSSANRTSRFFNAEDRKALLPDLNGEPFNFWRTRAQIFAAIAHTGEDRRDTIARLRQFQRIQEGAGQIREAAQRHASGHSGDIQSRLEDITGTVGDELARMRQEAANLGLLGNVARFQELTKIAVTRDDRAARLFLEICKESSRDTALEDMRTALRVMVSQSEFGSEASRSPLVANGAGGGRDPGRSVQYVPIRLIINRQSEHAATYQELVELYTVHMPRSEAVKKLLEIYNHFLRTQPPQEEPEYEAIRCLLYLSFFTKEGDQKACDLSRSLSRRYPNLRFEFRHVEGWAARRLKRLGQAVERAKECIASNPADPRFHHALGLALHDRADAVDGSDKLKDLELSVTEIYTAIDCYAEWQRDVGDLIGTCYNSLAYFLSRSPDDACFNLPSARVALAQLKVYVPSDTWYPMHPEYFHTEANFELQDVLMFGGSRDEDRQKLKRAQDLIDRALKLNGSEPYRVLKKDIEHHFHRLELA